MVLLCVFYHNKKHIRNFWSGCLLACLVAQSCPTLCGPMDCSPPGSSVHGIFQIRILEWIAISFSTGSAWPWDWTCVSCITGGFFTCWAIRKAPLMGLYHPKTSTGPHLRASRPKSLPRPTRACPVFCFHTLCELSESPSHGLLVHFHYRHAGTFTAFQTRQACFASGPLQFLFLCLVHFSPRYLQGWLPHLL